MTRADQFLVEQGYAKSRAEAQAAIKAGLVQVDGQTLTKSSKPVTMEAVIAYQPPHDFVSRGGVKLAAALDQFRLDAEGRVALDVGASTGGFSQVLLQSGAIKVYAVDVGHDQMHPVLARDPRIVRRDGVNARNLSRNEVPEIVTAITLDVSFIGLKLVLPPVMALAGQGAWMVALVKPQFEVGRDGLSKGGIVRDEELRDASLAGIEEFIGAQAGWKVEGRMESPIAGGDGNREFLVAALRS